MLIFWNGMATTDNGRGFGPIKGRPPEVIAYVNPFIAQADVLCGTELSFGTWCGITQSLVPGQNGVIFNDGGAPAIPVPVPAPFPEGGKGFVVDGRGGVVAVDAFPDQVNDVAPFGVVRDAVWPKSVATWLILSAVFLVLSIQLVSPTRRWRPHLPRRTSAGAEA